MESLGKSVAESFPIGKPILAFGARTPFTGVDVAALTGDELLTIRLQ